MKKTILKMMSMLIAVALSGCGGAKGKCDFKPAWEHGKVYTYRMDVNDTTDTRIPGIAPSIEKYRQSVHVAVTVDASGDSGARLEAMLLGARVGKPGALRPGAVPAWGTDLSGVGGASVVYRLDDNGSVTNVAGLGDFMRKIVGHSTLANATVGELLNEQFMKCMQFTGDDALPAKPARPGDSWTEYRLVYMPRVGGMSPSIRHVFKGWLVTNGMRQAHIRWAGVGEMPTNGVTARQPGVFVIRSWEIAGETLYFPDSRTITRWRTGMRVNGDVVMPGGRTAPQIVTRRMEVLLSGVSDALPKSGIIENKTVKVEKRRVSK